MTRAATRAAWAWAVSAAACASVAPIAGCALVAADPPRVEVAAVELRGLGVLDQSLGVTLCVSNPNDVEMAFRRVTVAVEVAGAPLAEGSSEVPVRLPPRSSVLVPFGVVTTARNLGAQLLGVVRAGGVEYRLRGTVQLGGPLALTLPFGRRGRLDLAAAGRGLLDDALAPAGSPCGASAI